MRDNPKVTFNELRDEIARALLSQNFPPTVRIANLVSNDLARAFFRLAKEDVSIRGEQNVTRSYIGTLLTIVSESIGGSAKV